ncbi:hypothetical protein OEZ86_008686 [Tetradesmus obliquus]|nr:hypothetical protein OEZ86_008686 [Tetradesmus obliquus]
MQATGLAAGIFHLIDNAQPLDARTPRRSKQPDPANTDDRGRPLDPFKGPAKKQPILENSADLQACGAPTFEWPAGSGFCWYSRSSGGSLQGPGPNYFNTSNVAVAASGSLQLTIQQVGGSFVCGEVFLDRSLGLGDYIFTVETDPSTMDKTLVGSPFLYADNGNEIDVIEYSRWNLPEIENSQFVLQPYTFQGSTKRYNQIGGSYTARMRWSGTSKPSEVLFEAWSPSGTLVASWAAENGTNFLPSPERVHINHWIFKPQGISNPLPAGFGSSLFSLSCFKHCPLGDASCTPMGVMPSCAGGGVVPPPPAPSSPNPSPSPSPVPLPTFTPTLALSFTTNKNKGTKTYTCTARLTVQATSGGQTPSGVNLNWNWSTRFSVANSGFPYSGLGSTSSSGVFSSTAPQSGVMSAATGGCTFSVDSVDLAGWQLAAGVQLPLKVSQAW